MKNSKCPICGKDNGCAFNSGKDPYTCWCMTTTVPKALLETVDQRGGCICKECVDTYYKNNQKRICVIGSLNVDLILSVNDFPLPGQTIKSQSMIRTFGGKGGNQAFASRKLESKVSMVGCVGNDSYGRDYLNHLKASKISVDLIKIADTTSGMAIIEVDHTGENKIITVGGANYELDKEWIDHNFSKILEHDVFLFSLEIPPEVSMYLMKKLKAENKLIILDPAPAGNFHADMLNYVDVITPNETEFKELLDCELPKNVVTIVKQGSAGSELFSDDHIQVSGYDVNTIDTVGAGDTFNAAIAYGMLFEFENEKLLSFANAAGALATTKQGAQTGMPSLKEIFILKNKNKSKH